MNDSKTFQVVLAALCEASRNFHKKISEETLTFVERKCQTLDAFMEKYKCNLAGVLTEKELKTLSIVLVCEDMTIARDNAELFAKVIAGVSRVSYSADGDKLKATITIAM